LGPILLATAAYVVASLVPGWRSWVAVAAVCVAGAIWTGATLAFANRNDWSTLFLAAALLPVWIGAAGGLAFRAVSLLRPVTTVQRALISGAGLVAIALAAWWIGQSL